MGKTLIYIACAMSVIILICAFFSRSAKNNATDTKPLQTDPTITGIQIGDPKKSDTTTINIWEYIKEHQTEKETIGTSENEPLENETSK
ncbi:MAG: hypothetical protein ACI4WH_03520 [Oscillospiraceae bacterium]